MLNKRSVCVITGASKGLGRCIAEHLSERLPPGSLFILMSRNTELLDEVSRFVSSHDGIDSVVTSFDQGSQDQTVFDNIFKESISKKYPNLSASDFEQAILINNAGSLEHLDYVRNVDSVSKISSYFNTNVTGYFALTSKFLQTFDSSIVGQRVIINITSIAATMPLKSWSLYSMGKAARDMFMKVVGCEEENIRTLNYAPGPLRTEMVLETARKETQDPELKSWFAEQIDDKKLLECEVTTKKLLDILSKDTFENGAHIDFYDEI